MICQRACSYQSDLDVTTDKKFASYEQVERGRIAHCFGFRIF